LAVGWLIVFLAIRTGIFLSIVWLVDVAFRSVVRRTRVFLSIVRLVQRGVRARALWAIDGLRHVVFRAIVGLGHVLLSIVVRARVFLAIGGLGHVVLWTVIWLRHHVVLLAIRVWAGILLAIVWPGHVVFLAVIVGTGILLTIGGLGHGVFAFIGIRARILLTIDGPGHGVFAFIGIRARILLTIDGLRHVLGTIVRLGHHVVFLSIGVWAGILLAIDGFGHVVLSLEVVRAGILLSVVWLGGHHAVFLSIRVWAGIFLAERLGHVVLRAIVWLGHVVFRAIVRWTRVLLSVVRARVRNASRPVILRRARILRWASVLGRSVILGLVDQVFAAVVLAGFGVHAFAVLGGVLVVFTGWLAVAVSRSARPLVFTVIILLVVTESEPRSPSTAFAIATFAVLVMGVFDTGHGSHD
jgi:hypothetical protein